jgi:hypothetical protein
MYSLEKEDGTAAVYCSEGCGKGSYRVARMESKLVQGKEHIG